MRATATEAELHSQDYGVHIHLLTEDWNEPIRYKADESFVTITHSIVHVMTPIHMWFTEHSPSTDSIVYATYRLHGEGDVISVIVVDSKTGLVGYQIGEK
jgi:hypothetical protein